MDNELHFTKSHEWIKWLNDEKTEAYVGISKYAADNLGDIVYVNIDEDEIEKGDAFGDIESVKAVSDLLSPFTGEVTKVNQEIINKPGLINEQSEEIWICKIVNIVESVELLTRKEYDNLEKD